jgi:hypothetical protein
LGEEYKSFSSSLCSLLQYGEYIPCLKYPVPIFVE